MDSDPKNRPKVGLPTKLAYGLGSVAFGVKDNGFRSFLVLFYNQVVGLPALWVTLAVAVAMVIDSLVDPLIGQLSDRWTSPWGRRHPFMYAAAVPAALSFLLLWIPPYAWSHEALCVYLIVVAVVVRSFITLFEIPNSALAAELTTDYDQRTSILGYRYFFGWWGGLALTVLTYTVLLQPNAHYPVGQLNRDGYALYGGIAATLMVLSILISTLGTHHHIPWLAKPATSVPIDARGHLAEMLESLKHKPFLAIAGVGLFAAAAEGLGFSIYFYLTTYFWALSPTQTGLLVTDGFIGSALAVALAPLIARYQGKKDAAMLLLVVTVGLSVAPLGLRLSGMFPSNDSPWLMPTLYGLGILRGALGITCAILVTAMIADVVEDSEVATGRRSEGVFFAAMSLINKSVSGLGALLTGIILTLIAFPTGVAPDRIDPDTIRGLALAYIPTIVVLYALALVCLSRYAITRERHEANLRIIASR